MLLQPRRRLPPLRMPRLLLLSAVPSSAACSPSLPNELIMTIGKFLTSSPAVRTIDNETGGLV